VSIFGKVSKVDIRERKIDSGSDRPSRYGFLTFSEVDSDSLLASSPFTVDNRAFSVERHRQPTHTHHHRSSGGYRGRNRNGGRGGSRNNHNRKNYKHDEPSAV